MINIIVTTKSGLEDKGRHLNSTTVKTGFKYPLCPYCFDGFIVEDNNKKGGQWTEEIKLSLTYMPKQKKAI